MSLSQWLENLSLPPRQAVHSRYRLFVLPSSAVIMLGSARAVDVMSVQLDLYCLAKTPLPAGAWPGAPGTAAHGVQCDEHAQGFDGDCALQGAGEGAQSVHLLAAPAARGAGKPSCLATQHPCWSHRGTQWVCFPFFPPFILRHHAQSYIRSLLYGVNSVQLSQLHCACMCCLFIDWLKGCRPPRNLLFVWASQLRC